jgi:hypothetical protein
MIYVISVSFAYRSINIALALRSSRVELTLTYAHTQKSPVSELQIPLTSQSSRLDIHYILLGETGRAQTELFSAATRATATVKRHQNFSINWQVGNWSKKFEKGLEFLLWEWDQWMLTDNIRPLRTKLFAKLGIQTEHFVLLRRHPVLCGMMLSRVNACMQHIDLGLVNYFAALPSVLHLYHACLAEGLLNKPW